MSDIPSISDARSSVLMNKVHYAVLRQQQDAMKDQGQAVVDMLAEAAKIARSNPQKRENPSAAARGRLDVTA